VGAAAAAAAAAVIGFCFGGVLNNSDPTSGISVTPFTPAKVMKSHTTTKSKGEKK